MPDPYQVLGLPPESGDDAIRRRYLELVRQFPPERHPERFAAVRQAYETLRDLDARLSYRLFERFYLLWCKPHGLFVSNIVKELRLVFIWLRASFL